MKDTVSVIGSSQTNVVLKWVGGGGGNEPVINIQDVDEVEIRNITIDGQEGDENKYAHDIISINNSSAVISGNIIKNAVFDGIVIDGTDNKEVIIDYNLIIDNGRNGIFIDGAAQPEIINNTISDNCKHDNSGQAGININAAAGSIVKIMNNIVSYQLRSSPQIKYLSGNITIQYNNFYGNISPEPNYEGFTPDTTNFEADPKFIDRPNDDYHLYGIAPYRSPCINVCKSDPHYNDPDGSRNDMGCYPYE